MAKQYIGIPDWVKNESDKYRSVFITYLIDMQLFPPENINISEYFDMHTEGWTQEDTEYIASKFIEHGIISPE